MENITLELIRQLRQETDRGLYDCKQHYKTQIHMKMLRNILEKWEHHD